MTGQGQPIKRFPLNQGLSKKILLMLVAGAATTTICSALFGYHYGYQLREQSTGAVMQQAAENVSDQIDASIDNTVRFLTLLANSDGIQKAFLEHETAQQTAYGGVLSDSTARIIQHELGAAGSSLTDLRVIRAVDIDERPLGSYGKLGTPYPEQERYWNWTTVTRQGKPAVSQPFFTEGSSSAAVLLCVPVRIEESGRLVGAIQAEYRFDEILNRAKDAEARIVAFYLPDREKPRMRIMSAPQITSVGSTNFIERRASISSTKRGWSLIETEQPRMELICGFAPVNRSFASVPIAYYGNNWYVIAGIPPAVTMAALNSLFFRSAAFGGIVLALVSLAGLAFARRILRPIHMLQQGVQEIGDGNLEHRLDVRSSDEIEMLASEFNRMADRMQRTHEQLQRRGKELEQRVNQLRRLQTQLTQSERMAATGELAAQIAHEINNPLGIIKNYVGIARMLMPEEDTNRENLKIVDQEINRIAGIVRRLLKFAKPGTEDIQQVQINHVLEELLALLRGQLFRRKIEIIADFGENLPEVNVSTDQMRQVFLNLIKNAEDAMPEGGKLMIGTRYKKGRVEIEIADNGCGIPSEDVKNIFEPFFTTKGVKGTGLGLSVSYGIVKNYNGEINVQSEPGKGTSFTIQLPVVSDKVFQVIRST